MKLKGKIAVVTGASSGMGRAISVLFAKEGASVFAIARRKEKLDDLVNESKNLEGSIVAFQGDVTQKDSMENILDEVFDKSGRIDILVNNAGIMDDMMPAGEVSDELWNKVIDVNLNSPLYLCRKTINLMMDKGTCNIINVASVGGLYGSRAGPAYTASKFGLIGLTKNIGFMYANKGIRCNAICPGGVETEIGVGMKNPSQFGMEKAMSGAGYNPRSGSSEEIANIALFLASDDSSFVNGTTIVADSGWTAY
ncbi:3-oxoacyl-[acyl-carrier-protein] reductase FabG [Gottschalkia acidurici 9a]|uniref:3-oxoacyl-[acyl-carrier-protein] reductase FabG n=1 Tax=Gottschalkia acidurici (strain ATCC 7906 / DSM 604 / BCRC 14475 / CIP 104303 / KCTC 5404 / NCIMB 10678 / 9a) TaxID=1128398 RepID=K0AXU6_GOTA9|nr:SDR family NAD(P)-dependent oxidoreductase [Gottschalkia acidurici]AFS78009.1 3-oxoacyl-[acyl-carrier-protein] reductase FabG [Gottschalkia acidurici 9a]